MGYRTDTLTIKSAAAYDLIALGGMGATEVAERWRVTEPTVTGHYNRAKRYYKEHPDERPVKPTEPGEKRVVRTVEVSKQELLEKVSNLSVRLLDSITDADIDRADLKAKAISAAIMIDKRQILRGEPTTIIQIEDRRKLHELLPLLKQEMERRSLEIDVTPIDSEPKAVDEDLDTMCTAREARGGGRWVQCKSDKYHDGNCDFRESAE